MAKNFAGSPMDATKQRDGYEKAKGSPPTSGQQSRKGMSAKGCIAGNVRNNQGGYGKKK